MKKSILVVSIIFLIACLLVIGNPSQKRFLNAVAKDYGSFHRGMEISPLQLDQIGTSRYDSYLLFSVYEYQFGNRNISYFGIAFMTFYSGSSVSDSRERIIKS